MGVGDLYQPNAAYYCFIKLFFFSGSIVKAGGKRVAKKSLEEGATHGTSEKETKRSDKLR